MIKKTISYHDYDGDMREDDFYFSLNSVQFAKLNRLFPNGLEAYIKKVTKDKNADELFRIIDTLVSEAYGERQGNAFVKVSPTGQRLADFFVNTEAYDNLMSELLSGEDTLINFLTGCLNQEAQLKAKAGLEKYKAKLAEGATQQEAFAAATAEQ